MAVITDNQTISSNANGFTKKIDASARTMMLDNLQTYMYQKPFHSCVKECASNAIDAVKEKEMAIHILSGVAQVSDYYVEKEIKAGESDIYADSKFNKDYYNLLWLDSSNTVKLRYINKEQTERDLFIISDPGVGLGGKRLEGFFNLGYSSKRLNTKELGGFGLGAKSPLATGVESYRMTTRYNGMEFSFDIYSHKVDCVYGRWNEDGTENPSVQFEGTDFKAYYKPTTLKNGTSIEVEVKKHNKQQYVEAVRSQLMYIKDDIEFWEEWYDGRTPRKVEFKAKIIYDDDDVILSTSTYYNKPHFVIKNVGYGLIDFNELELSTKFGNIGLRVAMEDIEVVPSRESVVYSQKTKDAVLAVYDRVRDTVQKRVNTSLNQDGFLEWIRACNRIMFSTGNSDDELARLSQLIDKSQLKPTYNDGEYRFTSDFGTFITPLLKMEYVHLTSKRDKNGKYVPRLTRDAADQINAFNKPTYLQFCTANNRTSSYIMTQHKDTGFSVLKLANHYEYLQEVVYQLQKGDITLANATVQAHKLISENVKDDAKAKIVHQTLERTLKLLTLLLTDKTVPRYDEVIVPESYSVRADTEEDEVDMDQANEEKRKQDQREREKRRRENKIFIGNKLGVRNPRGTYVDGFYREEVKFADLDTETCQLVYGTDSDDGLFRSLIRLKKHDPKRKSHEGLFYWNDQVKMLKVAKSNLRYVKEDGIHVNEYVYNVNDSGELNTFPEMKKVFTANLIEETLGDKGDFLYNFSDFDLELSTTFRKLRDYIKNNTTLPNVTDQGTESPVLADLYKAFLLNKELIKTEKKPTEEELVKMIGETGIANCKDIVNLNLIDEQYYKDALWVKNFVDVYHHILEYVDPLCDYTGKDKIEPELATEIKAYLRSKRDQLEGDYPGISNI